MSPSTRNGTEPPQALKTWVAAAIDLMRREGGRWTGHDLAKRLDPAEFGARPASVLAHLSTVWLNARGDDPALHVHRERGKSPSTGGQQPFVYWWDRTPRKSVADEPRRTHKVKATSPAPPADGDAQQRLQWARAHEHSNDVQARAAARDILAEHQRQRELHEKIPVNLNPASSLQERVEELQQLAETHPMPEKPDVERVVVPEPPLPPKEGFDVGDLIEVIGFAKNREPLVRDAAGNLYRIAIVEF